MPHLEMNSYNNLSNHINIPQQQHQQPQPQNENHINIDAQVQFPSNRNVVLNQNQIPPVRNNPLSYQNPTALSNMNIKNSAVNRIEDRAISVNSYNLAQQQQQQTANQNNNGTFLQNSSHNKIGYSGLSANSNSNIQHSLNITAHNMNTGLSRRPAQDHPAFNKKMPIGYSQHDDTNNAKKGKKSEVRLRKNKGSLETQTNRQRQVSTYQNINEDDQICFNSSQESQSQNLLNSHNMVTTSQQIYAPIKKDLIYNIYDDMHRAISTSQDIFKKNKEYLIKIKGAHIPDESKKCGTFYLIELENKPGDHIMFLSSDNSDFPFQIRSDFYYHVHLIDYSECNFSSRYQCVVYLCTMVEEWNIAQRR